MTDAYSRLENFSTRYEQPLYYDMLANKESFVDRHEASLLVASFECDKLMGGVLYFSDTNEYEAGGEKMKISPASGIRLLGVAPQFSGRGVGEALTLACMGLAREKGHAEVVLHTKNPSCRVEQMSMPQEIASSFNWRVDFMPVYLNFIK